MRLSRRGRAKGAGTTCAVGHGDGFRIDREQQKREELRTYRIGPPEHAQGAGTRDENPEAIRDERHGGPHQKHAQDDRDPEKIQSRKFRSSHAAAAIATSTTTRDSPTVDGRERVGVGNPDRPRGHHVRPSGRGSRDRVTRRPRDQEQDGHEQNAVGKRPEGQDWRSCKTRTGPNIANSLRIPCGRTNSASRTAGMTMICRTGCRR